MSLLGWQTIRDPAAKRGATTVPPGIAEAAEPDRQPVAVQPERVVEQNQRPVVEMPKERLAPPEPAPKPAQLDRRALTTQEIVAKSEVSVALIKGALGSGSGFIAAPGLVATNSHVIAAEPCHRLEVHFPSAPAPDRGPHRARLRYKDTRRDLALLEVETRLRPLELCRRHVFQRGEEVTIIGSPGFWENVVLKNAVNRGVVSTEVELNGQRFLQLGAAANPGNSGGPVFNAQGEVIGVLTGGDTKKQALVICVPVEDLILALDRAASLSRDQIAIAEKMQYVESIARRIRMARSIYARILSTYLDSMRDAVRVGASPRLAILETKREVGPRLAEMNERVLGGISAEINELAADPALAFQVRRDMKSLWDAFVGLQRFTESPPEDFRRFMATLNQAPARCDEQLERMARTLGAELDD